MSGNVPEAPNAGAGGVTELPGGYVKGKATDIKQIIERGFQVAEERRKGSGTTDGIVLDQQNAVKPAGGDNTAQTLNEIGVHTENLTEEEKRRQSLEGAFAEQLASLGKTVPEAPIAPPKAEAPAITGIPTPTTTEARTTVNEKPPAEDWETVLEADKQQKLIETQQAWIDLMDTMEVNQEAVPYFVKLGNKGENPTAEQRNLILIQPFKDQNGAEKYLDITKDGPRIIDATPENKNLINRKLLQKEDASMSDKLEKLESVQLTLTEGSDPISSVIAQSKETAKRIAEKSNEMKTLGTSRALAEKVKSSIASQQAPTSSIK